ncbi:MAG: hypothetical protein AAF483_29290 [Planctomycetota bacterium]
MQRAAAIPPVSALLTFQFSENKVLVAMRTSKALAIFSVRLCLVLLVTHASRSAWSQEAIRGQVKASELMWVVCSYV